MNEKNRILIVEDEPAIRIGLCDVFVFHGYEVEYCEDGKAALDMAQKGTFDLILLDVMLPFLNGFEVLEHIRKKNKEQAIIMLTAKSADDDVIQGLSLGADDYIAKPFSIAQLVLRVQAVLRRVKPAPITELIQLGHHKTINPSHLQGSIHQQTIHFTRREMKVLQYLQVNQHRPVTREELLQKVWGYAEDLDIETRTVDIHIAKIRKKIEDSPKEPMHLITIRGAGYKLICDTSL
jgi:two-component system, OmpR family, alkaline phosphatase synthesis response regulator PhoP